MGTYTVHSPLRVPVTKKKDFILNLNNYRNSHFHTLNKSKVEYKRSMEDQILALPKFNKIQIEYILYPKTKRRTDIGNVLAIHQKYFEDALQELSKIDDDSYEYIPSISFSFGSVDKNNPRVEIKIEEIQ